MDSLLLSIGVGKEFNPQFSNKSVYERLNGFKSTLIFPGLLNFFIFNAYAETDTLQITSDCWLFSFVTEQNSVHR